MKFFHNAVDLFFSQAAHEVQRSFFESQGHLAAEIEVCLGTDAAVDDVERLGKQNPQQPVPYRVFNVVADIYRAPGAMGQPAVYRRQYGRWFVMGAFLHLQGVGLDDDRVAVGHIQNKKRPGENKFFGHFVNLAGCGAVQKVGRVIAPVVEYAVQHKTDGIVGDYRRFAGFGKKPEQIIQHLPAAAFPGDDLHRQAAPGGGKKMSDRGSSRLSHI